ncbi:SAVMC3_10250 family protein [Amycolatopsis circi]|uniref:SAVMC3_10250 family protein n=1 Tax=Amycolatopsis circi TaxID=871959 RepID=UPI003CC5B435
MDSKSANPLARPSRASQRRSPGSTRRTGAPKWFDEPGVRAGQWVQSEAPASFGTAIGAVVFLDTDQPDDSYPGGGRLRLLPHGSMRHLVGHVAPAGVPQEVVSELYSWWSGLVRSTLRQADDGDSELRGPWQEFPRKGRAVPGRADRRVAAALRRRLGGGVCAGDCRDPH